MRSSVIQELRRTRRHRRLGELEWFEVAYRVYLAALVAGVALAWVSDLVEDAPVTASQLLSVTEHGPAWLGLLGAAAVALGLRSGSDGGPVSIEAGDARYLLLAPIPRRQVLLRPVGQRLRAMAFGGAIIGGIAGLFASRRLPGSTPAWAASGAAAGALVGVLFVATAVVAHALRAPRWVATAGAMAVVGWQLAAAIWGWHGPLDTIGSFAMWGMRTRPVDLVAVAVVAVLIAAALVLCDRLRIDFLTRRADLVSQLRFAVTMQDLRTVVLLRRQLRGERPRGEPWFTLSRSTSTNRTRAVMQRDLRGLARYPSSRLARMALLGAAGGLAAVATLRGTTPAMAGIGVVGYLLGLEAAEPLSQEVDRPDLTDGFPIDRGWLMLRHLVAPAVGLVPFAVVAAAVVSLFDPGEAVGAFALCLPVAWAAACGGIVSIVRDAPNPTQPSLSTAAVPPEFAGFTSSFRLLFPLLVSTISALTVLAMRSQPSVGTGVRLAVLDGLVIGATTIWVLRRDRISAWWQNLLNEGRAQRSSTT